MTKYTINRKELIKIKRGSEIFILDNIKDLESMRDTLSEESDGLSVTLINNLINRAERGMINLGDKLWVAERDFFDNTILVDFNSQIENETYSMWIPYNIVLSEIQGIPSLDAVTNDRLFKEWLDIFESRI